MKINRVAFTVFTVMVAILVIGGYRGVAERWTYWNLAYSDSIIIEFTEPNPVIIQLTDGTNFDYQALLVTENQEVKAYLTGEGFDLSQLVEVNSSELTAKLVGNSELQSIFSSAEKEVAFSAAGAGSVSINWDLGGLPHDSNNVQVLIKASGDAGVLRANIYRPPTITMPTDAQIVSRTLKVSLNQAEKLLQDKGVRLLNALEQLKRTGTRNGYSVLNGTIPAGGGAGGIEGQGGAIDVNSLDPASVFQVYFDNPKYKGNLKDSQLMVKLFHESTNTPIRGVAGTITVAGPVDGPNPGSIVLLDEIKYDEAKGYYFYQFDPEDWLIDQEKLQSGGYNLYMDFGRLQQTRLGVTITKDKKVFYGRY